MPTQYILTINDDGSVKMNPFKAPVVVTEPSTPVVVTPTTTSKIGVNSGKCADYQPSMFANMMLTGRKFVDTNNGWASMSEAQLQPNANGWPTVIPAGTAPSTIMTWDGAASRWPAGTYSITGTGDGTYTLITQNNRTVPVVNGQFTYTPSTDGGLRLTLTKAGITSINIHHVSETGFFGNGFLAAAAGFGCIRWMDSMQTNNSTVTDTLTPVGARSFAAAPAGVSPEAIGAASTALGCDAWVCMPHKCTNAYVTAFANRLKAAMPANKKVYVEFSNEIPWNGIFSQAAYFGATYAEQYPKVYKRAAEVVNIFKAAYGANCVRVIGSQSANTGTASQALSIAAANGGVDALAIAPYFGGSIHNAAGATDAALDSALTSAVAQMQTNQTIATNAGVTLLAYEGGSHMEGNADLVTASYSNKVGQIYSAYLAAWKALPNAGVFMCYNLIEVGGATGYWGLTQSYSDLTNPRYLAAKNAQ